VRSLLRFQIGHPNLAHGSALLNNCVQHAEVQRTKLVEHEGPCLGGLVFNGKTTSDAKLVRPINYSVCISPDPVKDAAVFNSDPMPPG